MIQVVNEQHNEGKLAGKWDIYVYDRSEGGDLLLFSNQGYENRGDAEAIIERAFGRVGYESDGVIDVKPEPVDLLTKWADGRGQHRMIR